MHEVTAISFHAYPHVADSYALMPCGGSIGDGYGPLLVAREPLDPARPRRPRGRGPRHPHHRLPGPEAVRARRRRRVVRPLRPDPRRGAAQGRADVGLIIHEGQLTYGGHGLHKVARPRRVVEEGDGAAPAPGRQRGAARPRPGADGAAHPPRARDRALLARPPRGGPGLRHDLRARHGPAHRRPVRRDVGERHDRRLRASAAARAVQELLDRGHDAGVIPSACAPTSWPPEWPSAASRRTRFPTPFAPRPRGRAAAAHHAVGRAPGAHPHRPPRLRDHAPDPALRGPPSTGGGPPRVRGRDPAGRGRLARASCATTWSWPCRCCWSPTPSRWPRSWGCAPRRPLLLVGTDG